MSYIGRSPRRREDFELVTEQYWGLHDDLVDVLASTTHPEKNILRT